MFGDRPVRVGVLRDVGVEQEDRDPADLGDPDRDGRGRDPAAGRVTRSGVAVGVGRPEQRQAVEVVVGVGVLLVAVGVDRLAEVALAVEQPDADERQGHVAGRLHVVAGQDAEPARVDPERLVEPVLGAEVGDRAVERGRVLAVEPVVRAVGQVRCRSRAGSTGTRPADPGSRASRPSGSGPRAAGSGCDSAPRPAPSSRLNRARAPGMPGPPQVVGQPAQAFELGWEPERDAGQRRDADDRIHRAA